MKHALEQPGTHWDGEGVTCRVFAPGATKVEICLFEHCAETARYQEESRLALAEVGDGVWTLYSTEIALGAVYGYRVHGPYRPETGDLFDPAKLLLDPYAKVLTRTPEWDSSLYSYTQPIAQLGAQHGAQGAAAPKKPPRRRQTQRSDSDSGQHAALAKVVAALPVKTPARPRTPLRDSVIYEVHVAGATKLHPDVPEELRGTYAGLGSAPFIAHLQQLGVTAVDLLPVHQCFDEAHLYERGLSNYWGYNTLNFFCLNQSYASPLNRQDPRIEFRAMVDSLHDAGIEVILDVVYNHSCEGSALGPTLSYRGFSNSAYYRLSEKSLSDYKDYTGCGNTFDFRTPEVRRLAIDSLCYFTEEFGVDGFRFDLAPVLGREEHFFSPFAPFFEELDQEEAMKEVKLIAEPWDIGEGGYQLGNFPKNWSEWNGAYRDAVRSFWVEQPGVLGRFADKIAGSSSLFQKHGKKRGPQAGFNFVTCHDGFTMRDLVSYNVKHNEANGEENRDGSDNNRSWNCGVEGPTDSKKVNELRLRQQKNLLATAFSFSRCADASRRR